MDPAVITAISRGRFCAPTPTQHDCGPRRPLTAKSPQLRAFKAEGPDGMFLIDQHAAHERILYEKLRAQVAKGELPVQPLLQPVPLELTSRQRAATESLIVLRVMSPRSKSIDAANQEGGRKENRAD